MKSTELVPLLGLALILAAPPLACAPEIAQDDPPPDAVVAQFDPGASVPIVPTPNDLAKDPSTGKLAVPSVGASAAERELNEEYLAGLDGFPVESSAEVRLTGDLDPESVSADSVVVVDLANQAKVVAGLTPRFDRERRSIVVAPPAGGWPRAGRYGVALIGGRGDHAVRGARGETVIGSPAWVLVSGETPLFECDPDAPNECHPTVDIIPSDKFDPHEKLADQVQKAKRLEQLRKSYAPLLETIAATQGVDKSSIPILWTFTVVDGSELTFDPGNGVIPFPNDAVRTGPDGTVSLPHPKTGAPLTREACRDILSDPKADRQVQLTCGLNTLDGFSTQVAPVSESSAKLGALQQGASLDASSIDTTSVGLIAVESRVAEEARTTPQIDPCVGCLSSDPSKAPQQLQWRLKAPLDERTTYLAYVTTDAKDSEGRPVVAPPAFAFLRSRAPLVEGGKSTVNTLPTPQALALEPLRAAMAPALDALEKDKGIARSKLALAFTFTTQSEASVLEQLRTVPDRATGLPASPVALRDMTTQLMGAAAASKIPMDGVGKLLAGSLLTPVLVTGASGTFNPDKPSVQRVDFTMSIPSAPAPATGYPVVVFGHGFTRSRSDMLAIASAMSKTGHVVIATDVLFHGERTSCTGSKIATKQSSDDAACASPTTQRCNGDPVLGLCVARDDSSRNACAPGPSGDAYCRDVGQGRCAPDLKCQAGDLARDPQGRPLISGWNMLSLTNFFATRDNFRQQVIDLSQLVRVLKSDGATSLTAQSRTTIDATRIHYVGQSLGGILGALYNSVSPDTTHVALNVPGGALPQIIMNAPSFAEQKAALLGALEEQGILPGTPELDQFLGVVQWILDPADPANVARRLTHGVDVGGTRAPSAQRKTFIQFIEGDQTVPNISNLALIRAASASFTGAAPTFGCAAPLYCYELTEAGDGFTASSLPLASRHGFLLAPTVVTAKAQTQVATFLATGGVK